MNNERIDVLAGLSTHAAGMRAASASGGLTLSKVACGNIAKELTDIHAAVDELIEAAGLRVEWTAGNWYVVLADGVTAYSSIPQSEEGAKAERNDALRAAIARAGGVA